MHKWFRNTMRQARHGRLFELVDVSGSDECEAHIVEPYLCQILRRATIAEPQSGMERFAHIPSEARVKKHPRQVVADHVERLEPGAPRERRERVFRGQEAAGPIRRVSVKEAG